MSQDSESPSASADADLIEVVACLPERMLALQQKREASFQMRKAAELGAGRLGHERGEMRCCAHVCQGVFQQVMNLGEPSVLGHVPRQAGERP